MTTMETEPRRATYRELTFTFPLGICTRVMVTGDPPSKEGLPLQGLADDALGSCKPNSAKRAGSGGRYHPGTASERGFYHSREFPCT
jgi:hypothetical protein